MEWISATVSTATSDLLSAGVLAVIAYALHWWRTRTLSGQISTLKEEIRNLKEGGGPSIVFGGNISITNNHYHAEIGQYRADVAGEGEIVSPVPISIAGKGSAEFPPGTAHASRVPTKASKNDG